MPEILGKELNIRVGGSFVWPPTGVDVRKVKNVVFIAGGVGIKYVKDFRYRITSTSQRNETNIVTVH